MVAFFFWDPVREMLPFKLPLLDRPILWYGFFFALGFFLGYCLLLHLLRGILKEKHAASSEAKTIAEKMTLYVAVGTLIGARLGDVLFYQNWRQIAQDPLYLIAFWQGGLASHGGVLGILIALGLLNRKLRVQYSWISWRRLLDIASIPAGVAAACIRVGNFFNQEILGTPTELPWGVVFGHPADFSAPIPRHPVQLYEAFAYLLIFFALWFLWEKKKLWHKPGKIAGLFFMIVFGFRLWVEWFKEEQSVWLSDSSWTMGQLLSLPCIAFGIYLYFKRERS